MSDCNCQWGWVCWFTKCEPPQQGPTGGDDEDRFPLDVAQYLESISPDGRPPSPGELQELITLARAHDMEDFAAGLELRQTALHELHNSHQIATRYTDLARNPATAILPNAGILVQIANNYYQVEQAQLELVQLPTDQFTALAGG